MIYGYIRVSTDKQTVENQRFEIENFCYKNELNVDSWFEETISGTKDIGKREIGKLLVKMKADDILICSEISRIGRSLFMVMSVLNECTQRGIKVWMTLDYFVLTNMSLSVLYLRMSS